jgi:predicted Ser/Thr protein kinase
LENKSMKFEDIPHFNPQEKSQGRLQAQTEVFADRGVKNFSEDQAQILKYSAELSQIKDLNNLPPDLPEELVALIQKHKDAYVNFLRQERKLETSFIEENIKTYKEKFQPVIAELKAKMSQGNFKELPEYLGSGSNGSAFRIEVDGKNYAAKFSRSITQANFEIKPLIRAKNIPHTSQLVSYSFEDGVVIMELLPGSNVANFKPEEDLEYPDEHITQLIDTVRELDAKGLVIDPKPSNFIYDNKQGFSILDYHLKSANSRYRLPQQIIGLKNALTARKFERLDYKAPDYEEKSTAQSIEKYKIYLPLMVRFLNILKNKYHNILADWQRQHDEDKANPSIGVSEIIDREHIPKHPDLEKHLKKLEEMGF